MGRPAGAGRPRPGDCRPPPPRPAGAPPPSFESAPPDGGERTPELTAAYEWLKREKARLEAYTRSQLSHVRAERQAALSQHYVNEQGLVLWSQELNRKEEFLAQQGRSLQQQAVELSQWGGALLKQLEQRRQAEEELLVARRASVDVRRKSTGCVPF